MLKRHENEIWSRLDELYANGTTFISWGEIYYWYGVQKIKKTPWRDIKSKWTDLLEEQDEEYKDPLVSETTSGVSLFFSKNPGSLSKLAE